MTWNELTQLEPRLHAVEADALKAYRSGLTDWSAWEAVKRRFGVLVGWMAANSNHPQLTDQTAYDSAYRHLLACFETGRRPRQLRVERALL